MCINGWQLALYLFKNVEKPNFICSASRKFEIKALGFTRSLVNAVYLEKVVFFYDSTFLGASVQPNLQDDTVFSKIDSYGTPRNRAIGVNLAVFSWYFILFSVSFLHANRRTGGDSS